MTAMLDIGAHAADGLVTLADVAERQCISLSYLEQLFARLRRRGLVDGVRGPGGGYSLARPAAEISVANVIVAVDEKLQATDCGGSADCHQGRRCMTHDLWEALSDRIYQYLDGITLEDLLSRSQVRRVVERQNGVLERPVVHG